MKKIIYLFTVIAVLMCGCNHGHEDDSPITTTSKLIFKGSDNDLRLRDMAPSDPIVFTGDDVLWFNGTTKEIRFRDNMYQTTASFSTRYKAIMFYFDKTYLFSSLLFVSDINSQIINSLVFYYSTTENRYYLKDGYPELSAALQNALELKQIRDANMKKIEKEWGVFIAQLKTEGKYKE